MRNIFLFLFLTVCTQVSAQLLVDGRVAMWDRLTNTFLATMPDTCFNKNVRLSIQSDIITVNNLNNETVIPVSLKDSTGQNIDAKLQFTFLPIVLLSGDFTYNYQAGTLLLSCPDSLKTDTLAAKIKWRGGSTNEPGKHKRNYTVKLTNDTTLLGMRNDNKWILDAGQADVFRLRNRVAMDLWNDMARKPYYADRKPNARNGVSGKVVELFLNDEYRGIYNFSENLDRKQMKLKKVENGTIHGCLYKVKQFGYGNMNDTVDIYDNHSEMWEYIEVKYPDLSDNDTTDWSPLYNAINFVVMSSDEEFANHVADYFDMPIVTDISVFISVVNGLDNRGKNIMWAVYDKQEDKKLTPAPWDLDCTVGQEWVTEDIRGPEILFDWEIGLTNRLIKNNVLNFNDSLNYRYKQLREELFTPDSLFARYHHYYDMLKRSGAAQREETRWSGDSDVRGETIDFDKEINYIRKWIDVHIEWLDGAWYPLDLWYEWYESQGINETTAHPCRPGIYTLNGQKIDARRQNLHPGIYIINGKKTVVK